MLETVSFKYAWDGIKMFREDVSWLKYLSFQVKTPQNIPWPYNVYKTQNW